MKKVFLIIVIALFFGSCVQKVEPGKVTDVFIQPGTGGLPPGICIVIQSDDSLFYKRVQENEVDKIRICGINGYNDNSPEIRHRKLIFLDRNRYEVILDTRLKFTDSIMNQNEIIDSTIDGHVYTYWLSEKNVGVLIGSGENEWTFGSWKEDN